MGDNVSDASDVKAIFAINRDAMADTRNRSATNRANGPQAASRIHANDTLALQLSWDRARRLKTDLVADLVGAILAIPRSRNGYDVRVKTKANNEAKYVVAKTLIAGAVANARRLQLDISISINQASEKIKALRLT